MGHRILKYLSITALTFATQISLAQPYHPQPFEGAEHIASGDSVKLYFFPNDPGEAGQALEMPNGLKLTYGDIVSFGDFYEIPDQPIAMGKTPEERKQRFLKSFNSFAYDNQVVAEALKILDVLHENRAVIDAAMQRGEDPEIVFQRIAGESNRRFNCITGGSCAKEGWWLVPGRYLKLAETDFDHFGEEAWIAYQVGHEAALEIATQAHQTNDVESLKIAYAMNAFACHFLTDRFAAGHMRSPRKELPANVKPSITGALLVHFMHDEDNFHGLHVHNARGSKWIAYGDKAYFSSKNKDNREMLQHLMQISALEIFNAYLTGKSPTDKMIEELLPHPDEINDQSVVDISPLFYWDKEQGKIMRRVDLANVYDRRWTDNWWGWSTLLLLADIYGIPGHSQARLAQSPYASQAVKDKLITDKAILKSLEK